jgi:hypothetical protein
MLGRFVCHFGLYEKASCGSLALFIIYVLQIIFIDNISFNSYTE